MKGLKLNINSPRDYVRAISGLFITPAHPNGLTEKEQAVVAKLMEHGSQGNITEDTRKKSMQELNLSNQNFYNTMHSLKKKQAVRKSKLHPLFSSPSVTINAGNSRNG